MVLPYQVSFGNMIYFFLQQFLNYFLTKKTKIFVQMLFSENINYINNLFANLLDKW